VGEAGGPVGTPAPPGEIVHDLSDPDRFAGHMSILQDGAPVGTLSLSHGAGTALADLPGIARELRRAAVVSLTLGLPLMGLVAILVLGRIEGRLHGRMLAVERGRHDDPLAQAIRRLRDAAPR